jgi:hypothetical protein
VKVDGGVRELFWRQLLFCFKAFHIGFLFIAVSYAGLFWAKLFEISRRTTWPFHIHNPETTMIGTKTKRVLKA